MIYTGYFDRLADYRQAGLTPVCIAGYAPTGYTGARFPALAPKKVWWQEWHDNRLSNAWYEARYTETVLNKLSAVETAASLHTHGDDVVLLCFEKPPQFCHRHLVAHWFLKHHIAAGEYSLERT